MNGSRARAVSGHASLATVLRQQRVWLCLTQRQVAEHTGLSLRTVRGLETGRIRRPQPATLSRLAGALALDAATLGAAALDAAAPLPPAQLPPSVVDFTGRRAAAAQVAAALGGDRVVVVSGAGGMGKTALAVDVAHAECRAYPDGQLVADLGGTTASPRAPAEILARFLRALATDEGAVPPAEQGRDARYRAMLAERRVLVVLDDARDALQVRPLLPGAPGCGVLVTARRPLEGLAGACDVRLGPLHSQDAVALLAAVTGRDRILAEPAAAAAVVHACGGVPLAVRIAGLRLLAEPDRAVGWLAARLADDRRRRDELRAGDLCADEEPWRRGRPRPADLSHTPARSASTGSRRAALRAG